MRYVSYYEISEYVHSPQRVVIGDLLHHKPRVQLTITFITCRVCTV